jgi:hypothetical protein
VTTDQQRRRSDQTVRSARPPWWRLPFRPDTYRSTVFLLISVPVGVAAVIDGGAVQRRAARRLLRLDAGRSRVRGLLGVPLDLVALAVIGYCWIGVIVNVLYPLRPVFGLSGDYRGSWGGPTLVGAWAVHAVAGLAFWLLVAWLLRGYAGLWRRLVGA